jgi:hypothetical protein
MVDGRRSDSMARDDDERGYLLNVNNYYYDDLMVHVM